ncbi:hypothetical protein SG34_002750 [Thalassomonas viridans]|uniref:PEP-CTERM protein-sorting domain-containing protein n=1 Tax=Thalassomonas viridans TaxID=137584 RepID=A0AAE9Z402_9GAMM|nr:hypothetical protein [Thalassomonas viridans]WDE05872.1 hypothetical protein SG34_002750 [Thalassomonas viridans]
MKKFLLFLSIILIPLSTYATPINMTIGDNDGFGFGIADNASVSTPFYDNRDSNELSATDGSQHTDIAYYPHEGVYPIPAFDIIFPVMGNLISGVFTFDVQGIQLGERPDIQKIEIYFNGILQENLHSHYTGGRGSAVISTNISDEVLAAGQGSNEFVVTIGENRWDAVGYDFFNLTGEVEIAAVPAPASLMLLIAGLMCLFGRNHLLKK